MSGNRQTILRPVGLCTQPNKFGQYVDGALQRAINCVMRNPGELDAAPSMFPPSNTGIANNIVHKLMPLDAGHTYELSATAGGVWTVNELGNAVALPSFCSTTSLFSATGRISPVRAKDRVFFNSNNGYLVGDNMAPATAGERALRLAGLPQLSIGPISRSTPTTGGSISFPGLTTGVITFGYVALHTRTFADGYKIVSVPTPVVKLYASSFFATFSPQAKLAWASADVALAGDVIELYRTDGIFSTDINTEPPPGAKLVQSTTLTSADIALGSVTLTDNSVMGAAPYYSTTGRELYCNPGQGGSTTINRQPPVAKCTATYDGRQFYANIFDRPKLTFKIPAGVGTSQFAPQQTSYWRAAGIGIRQVDNLTATLGSPTLTGGTAASLAGVVPGQRWYGADSQFPRATAFVSAVNPGAGTVTMSSNFLAASTTINATFADCMYIGFNGGGLQPYRFADAGDLLLSVSGQGLITTVAHQFEVTANGSFMGGLVGGTSPTNGVTVTYNPNIEISLEPRNYGQGVVTMQVTATNGANYAPPLPEFGATAQSFTRTQLKNFMIWSKDQQPEHVAPGAPQANSTFVGLREVIAMVNTKDALWIACLDGIFRLTGVGGQYRLDTIDSTKIICAPQAICSLDENVFLYSNFGVLQLNSETRDNLTDTIIGDLLTGPQYAEVPTIQMVANETDLEVLLLDAASSSRLYVYMTKTGGGWTTLENNPAALSNITALAFMRSPASGDARVIVGTSPQAGALPNYAGWGNTASFLTMDFLYQPSYDEDPLGLKLWTETSYIFDVASVGKTLRPSWNGVPIGQATVALDRNAAYARAGIPRNHGLSVSIAAGCDQVTGAAPQARFLGLSLLYVPLTNAAKQR